MIGFELIFPVLKDAELVLKWRNDKDTLKMSFSHREAKTIEEFFPFFLQNYYTVPALPPLFAIVGGERIGIVRFDPAEIGCEISLVVAPEKRGQGFGTKILLALDSFLKRQQVNGVLARILEHNQASIRTFTKAGYQVIENGEVIQLEKHFFPKEKHVFIIAEAGSNWCNEGDEKGLERALQMVEEAKNAGADAVKFQTFRTKDIYAPNAGKADYLNGPDIEELFHLLEISDEMVRKIADHCAKTGIEFMSSVFSERDFQVIDPLVKRHKIASYEITYDKLISLASKKPLILSTGASNKEVIDRAVFVFKESGGMDLTLMQCTAKYPAASDIMNLNVIPWLKSRYQVKIGLSDHSLDPLEAPLAAVALGAVCIEKHFTLDRTLKGPDHLFALEPHELKQLVFSIREVEKMLGASVKQVQADEKELYNFCQRRIQALQDIHPGEVLSEKKNIGVLRPGKNIPGVFPYCLSQIEGKKSRRAISRGEGIKFTDLE